MNHHGRLSVVDRLDGIFENDIRRVIEANVIDHDVVSVGKAGVGQGVQVERRCELRVDELAQVRGQMGGEILVIVIAAAGEEQSFQWSRGRICVFRAIRGQAANFDVA